MRGKKIDRDFVSQFILSCSLQNKCCSHEIINEAKDQISKIDSKIQEIENLKKTRSKLLDVILSFDTITKEKFSEIEKQNIHLFKIDNLVLSKEICDLLKSKNDINIKDINKKYSEDEIIWCLKQLLTNKVIIKINNIIIKGDNFRNYLKFVMSESDTAYV